MRAGLPAVSLKDRSTATRYDDRVAPGSWVAIKGTGEAVTTTLGTSFVGEAVLEDSLPPHAAINVGRRRKGKKTSDGPESRDLNYTLVYLSPGILVKIATIPPVPFFT
jgi:hypothetical protein